jgi:hypothetical protein
MTIHIFRLSSDYLSRLQKLDAAYAKAKKPKATPKTTSTAMDGVGNKNKVVPDGVGEDEVPRDNTMKTPAAHGNRRYVPRLHSNPFSY